MIIANFLFVIIYIVFAACFQNQYIIVPHHCESPYFNRSLLNYFNFKCDKRSRTELYMSINWSCKMDITSDAIEQVKITGYVFKNNLYLKGPIEFMLGFCSSVNSKLYDIPHLLSDSNIKCPLKKGKNYYITNVHPNATNMPPLIPPGDWMFEFTFMYLHKYIISTVRWFVKIEYPVLPFY